MKQLFFLFIIVSTFSLQAQEKGAIEGKILDAELYNEPLLMASISLQGTSWSTQTNFNGNFEITDITPGNYIMQVSFLGYEDVNLPIVVIQDEATHINRSLKAKTIKLSDMEETEYISNKKYSIIAELK